MAAQAQQPVLLTECRHQAPRAGSSEALVRLVTGDVGMNWSATGVN
jgi:hypothetical protein